MTRALVDTSVLVASESGRPLGVERIPDELAVSVITLGELHAGVLAAAEVATRDQRLRTLEVARELGVASIDERAAAAWARLRVDLRDAGRSMPVNDSWIAASAISLGVAVVTQDDDYDGVPGLDVVKV